MFRKGKLICQYIFSSFNRVYLEKCSNKISGRSLRWFALCESNSRLGCIFIYGTYPGCHCCVHHWRYVIFLNSKMTYYSFRPFFLINAYMSVYCRWFGCGYLHRCPASSHPHYRCSDSYWTRYCYLFCVFNNIVFTFCLPSKNVKASDVPSCCVRLRNSILMFNMSTKSTQIEFINWVLKI